MDAARLGSGVIWTDTADAADLSTELAEHGWRTARCELAADADKALVISAIATALDFPDWTGRNLDALYDSLTDLSWIDETRVMLTVVGASAVDAATASWDQIRTVLVEAVEWWHTNDRTLVIAIA